MRNDLLSEAKDIITNNRYLVLATSLNDAPWAAPLFFAVDNEYNFYFVSGKEARHSIHIQSNANVAITIYDSHEIPERADGVYVEGLAEVVGREDLPRIMEVVYLKRFPDEQERSLHVHPPEDFLGDSPRRFYLVTPKKMYKLDRTNTSGVDTRVELDLSKLRNKHPIV